MEGIIINYRRGRKTQKTNQMIVMIPDVDKDKALKLIGKEVIYVTAGKLKKQIKGKISSTHGNKGAVRVLFEKGMPGQAIGAKVEVKA
jgi:large subunit ribosomal protein L35Ae